MANTGIGATGACALVLVLVVTLGRSTQATEAEGGARRAFLEASATARQWWLSDATREAKCREQADLLLPFY